MKRLFFVLLLSTFYPLKAQTSLKAKALLDKVANEMNAAKNLQFGFTYTLENKQEKIRQETEGNVTVAQGGGIQSSGWRNGGNFTVNFGSTFTAGHIHQVAIDVDNGKFFYGIQNTYYAADAGTDGNPSAGTNETSTFAFSTTDVVLLAGNYSGTQYWNFGQDGTFAGQQTAQGNSDANGVGNFYFTVPTGYQALCTKNLGS